MAETRSIDPFDVDFSAVEAHNRPVYRRISLMNGLLIGLAIGLGAWGVEMVRLSRLPVTSYRPALVLGIGAVTVLCGLVGWFTGRLAKTPLTVVMWALAAVASMLVMGYLPFNGRTYAVWLVDPRFRGRDVYPYTQEGSPSGLILGGLLIILVLVTLGLLQNYRLEHIVAETSRHGRLNGRGWLSLLLPLPLVFLASLITQRMLANPSATAIEVTNQALVVAQDYEGDLRLLNLGDGISYASLQPVKELLGSDYTLSIVDVNPVSSTEVVGVDLAAGGWVYCRVINDQLTFCYDAAPSYLTGLRSLATGEPLPEDCRGCALRSTEEAAAFLAARRDRFGREPVIDRVAQQGNHVLMRVTGEDDFAVECWVVGVAPTQLTECNEVESSGL